MKIRFALLACAALLPAAAASADTIFYSNTFENNILGAGWSSNAQIDPGNTNFTKFLGRYSNQTNVSLTVPVPPPDSVGTGGSGGTGGTGGTGGGGAYRLYTLTFDFYPIDTWDGDDTNYGPDRFKVWANGINQFDESFANQHTLQSFRAPDVGRSQLGYGLANDSIYRNIAVPFTIDPGASTLTVTFGTTMLQGMSDESWGVDNVRLSYSTVPSPGSLCLLSIGAIAGGMRPRRR